MKNRTYMGSYTLTDIIIYPIKSLGGISLTSAKIDDRGLLYDRRWMLVDDTGRFLSQREHAVMALLQVHLTGNGLRITHKEDNNLSFTIPFTPEINEVVRVTIWDDTCEAVIVSEGANTWFSHVLQIAARLVYMPYETRRKVDDRYTYNNEVVSFADGYPFLIIGQASLDNLNRRLDEPIPMNRFRPNLVFSGGIPFEEDTWGTFRIGEAEFRVAKPCARCVVITIDQNTGLKGAEPLKTLATFRKQQNKIMVGQNLVHTKGGTLRVHDAIELMSAR